MKIFKEVIRNLKRECSSHHRSTAEVAGSAICTLGAAFTLFAVNVQECVAEVAKAQEQKASEIISYGSRVGMELTIVSKSGIGTSNSVIRTKMTEANARSYCLGYIQDSSPECIKSQMNAVVLSKTIQANCDAKEFRNFYGESFRYVPARHAGSNSGTLINLRTGEALDGSSASGLSYNLQQFTSLCPSSSNPGMDASARPPNSGPSETAGRTVHARGSGVLPGAIICSDLQTVKFMQTQFARYWEETNQDRLTRGQSQLILGRAAPYPNFSEFGCALVQAGSTLVVEDDQPVPLVSAQLPDGKVIRGVTFSYMYGNGNSRSPF
jgi:hypothetical protein